MPMFRKWWKYGSFYLVYRRGRDDIAGGQRGSEELLLSPIRGLFGSIPKPYGPVPGLPSGYLLSFLHRTGGILHGQTEDSGH